MKFKPFKHSDWEKDKSQKVYDNSNKEEVTNLTYFEGDLDDGENYAGILQFKDGTRGLCTFSEKHLSLEAKTKTIWYGVYRYTNDLSRFYTTEVYYSEADVIETLNDNAFKLLTIQSLEVDL